MLVNWAEADGDMSIPFAFVLHMYKRTSESEVKGMYGGYGYGGGCCPGYGYGGGYGGSGSTFVLVVVLFILLIIVGASFCF